MSNLYTQQGVDFDTWFSVGQGSQFLSIYGDNGQDIGQSYLAGSGGPATSWFTPDGQDLNTKLGGYGYGIYRVGGYPWNFHWGDFNLANHVNWWKSWLKTWGNRHSSVKCVSGITNDCYCHDVNSDYHYSICIFGWSPVGGAPIEFTYSQPNIYKSHRDWYNVVMGYIEISPYLKGIVVRCECGAGGRVVAEIRTAMSQAGQPTVAYNGAFGIGNDDNHPTTANSYWNYSNWGKNWVFHL